MIWNFVFVYKNKHKTKMAMVVRPVGNVAMQREATNLTQNACNVFKNAVKELITNVGHAPTGPVQVRVRMVYAEGNETGLLIREVALQNTEEGLMVFTDPNHPPFNIKNIIWKMYELTVTGIRSNNNTEFKQLDAALQATLKENHQQNSEKLEQVFTQLGVIENEQVEANHWLAQLNTKHAQTIQQNRQQVNRLGYYMHQAVTDASAMSTQQLEEINTEVARLTTEISGITTINEKTQARVNELARSIKGCTRKYDEVWTKCQQELKDANTHNENCLDLLQKNTIEATNDAERRLKRTVDAQSKHLESRAQLNMESTIQRTVEDTVTRVTEEQRQGFELQKIQTADLIKNVKKMMEEVKTVTRAAATEAAAAATQVMERPRQTVVPPVVAITRAEDEDDDNAGGGEGELQPMYANTRAEGAIKQTQGRTKWPQSVLTSEDHRPESYDLSSDDSMIRTVEKITAVPWMQESGFALQNQRTELLAYFKRASKLGPLWYEYDETLYDDIARNVKTTRTVVKHNQGYDVSEVQKKQHVPADDELGQQLLECKKRKPKVPPKWQKGNDTKKPWQRQEKGKPWTDNNKFDKQGNGKGGDGKH